MRRFTLNVIENNEIEPEWLEPLYEYLGRESALKRFITTIRLNSQALDKILSHRRTPLIIRNAQSLMDVKTLASLIKRHPRHSLELSYRNMANLTFEDIRNLIISE